MTNKKIVHNVLDKFNILFYDDGFQFSVDCDSTDCDRCTIQTPCYLLDEIEYEEVFKIYQIAKETHPELCI